MVLMKETCKPLTEEEYAKAFATFVAGSTEYEEIPKMMKPVIDGLNGRKIDLMSIGAGTGCIEDNLIQQCDLKVKMFLAIEPNIAHRNQLQATVASWGEVDLEIDPSYFDETYKTEKKFDLILMSHSMYCVDNPVQIMIKAVSYLKPSGKLIIFNQTERGGHELYLHLRRNVSMDNRPINDHFVTTKYIADALLNNGINFELSEAPSTLDVTDFIKQNGSSTANDVVTFFLQTNYEALNDDLKKSIYEMVKDRCVDDEHGRHMFSHPNGMVFVSAN
ncbi:carnosine N-methyltransferase 2-like [Rhopilema esculentum]|uniref:carnosine N-methyltransferase 2-like n=1 Tax=Rhopilema esculentum TaxID=499914 RepID=UPI0031CF3776|eukprot:gene10729-19509_t